MKWLLPLLLATPSLALWNPLKRRDTGSKVPCTEVFNCNQDTQYCNGNTGECVQFDDCRGTPGSCGVGKYCVPLAPDNSFNYTCSDSPPVSSSSSAAPSSTSSAPPSGPSKSCNGYSPLGTCGDGAFCNGFGHGMFGCLYYNDCRGPNVVCGSGESCKAVAPQFPFSAISYECIANGASAPVPTDGPNRPNIPVDAQGYPIVCDPNADACPNGGFCKPTPPLDYYRETNNFCDYYFDCRNPYNVCPSGQVCQSAGFEWINCVDANSTSSSMSMSGMSLASNSASTTSSASSTTPSNLPDVNDCRNTGCSHHETCGLVSSGLNVTYGCFDSSRPLDCRNGGCTSDQVCEYYQRDTTSGYVCFNNASLPTGQDCRTGSGCPGGICGLNGQGFVCLFNTTSPSMSSSMVSSVMSGSSMVSMVSSAFSSGPISSPAPTQMSSAAGPGPAPSVVSQTGSPAPAPSSGGGGSGPAPSSAGSNPAPSQGGNSPAPSQGGNSPAPSQGGSSPAPSQGGNSPAPSQGGNSPAPSQGGNSPAPSQGSGGSGGNPMGNTIDLVAIYNLLHQIKKELDEVKADVKAIKAKIGA